MTDALANALRVAASQTERNPTDAQKGKGGRRVALSAEIDFEAVRLYRSGLTQDQTARRLGIGSSTVCKILRRNGAQARKAICSHAMPEEVRLSAVSLYRDHEHTIPEVASILGVGTTTIARWLATAGVGRSMSEAFAIATQKGRKQWGRSPSIPWQSSKTGVWEFADSRWEVVRMRQLDDDTSVTYWTKRTPRVPYVTSSGRHRTYAPDFWIAMCDGSLVVEEIKPERFVNDPSVKEKTKAARAYFLDNGIGFKVLTEFDVGVDEIKGLRISGLASAPENEARRLKNARTAARLRSKNAPRVEAERRRKRERSAAIVEAYVAGLSMAEVGRMFDIAPSGVWRHLVTSGTPRRPFSPYTNSRSRE